MANPNNLEITNFNSVKFYEDSDGSIVTTIGLAVDANTMRHAVLFYYDINPEITWSLLKEDFNNRFSLL